MSLLVLQDVTFAEVRTMLRTEAIEVALGAALVVVGLLTLALSAAVRRRVGGPPWLGLFALLYGTRLLIRSVRFVSRKKIRIMRGLTPLAITQFLSARYQNADPRSRLQQGSNRHVHELGEPPLVNARPAIESPMTTSPG